MSATPMPAAVAADPRPILFISDLHLSPALPRTVAAFEHFIVSTAAQAQAVYILGDLFEYWIGDDELDTPFAARQCELLRGLSARGIALHVMCGNRDFLLGPRFAHAAGADLLDDPCVLQAFGLRLVLSHGDALCTLDLPYQRFRRLTRTPFIQRGFLAAPLRWRMALARTLRRRSALRGVRAYAQAPDAAQARWDVTNEAVNALLAAHASTILIHGHTHRPGRHDAPQRWVLPDWELDHGPARGGYLKLDAQGLRFEALEALEAH